MNQLSWMLYLADVAGSLGALCAIYLIVGGIGGVAWVIISFAVLERVPAHLGKIIAAYAVVSFIGVLAPSKQTVYMIVGSEIGEKMAKTPEAQELYDIIRQRVKDTLKAAGSPAQK